MIDIYYYADLLLPKEDSGLVIKYFGKKQFDNLNKAQFFFKNQDESKLSWIKEAKKVSALLKLFGERLDELQLSLEEKQMLVLDKCDRDSNLFSFLEIRGSGRSTTCRCPNPACEDSKKSAWIPEQGTAKSVMCNHRTSCGFSGDFIAAYGIYYGLSYGKALNSLADELGIDFTVDEHHYGDAPIKRKKQIVIPIPVAKKESEINYMTFNKNKKYRNVDYKTFLDSYPEMNERQQFMMIATAIYKFSLSTDQKGKINYFKSIGIDSTIYPALKEKVEMVNSNLGYLSKEDIEDMLEHLKALFSEEDLIKYGVINPELEDDGSPHPFALAFKQNVEESLVVIPNFDLYTNMCSGLKYRKTKVKSWFDKKKNKIVKEPKEPEFSHGRIAQPLPYHLAREALADLSFTFRFFEGQKDLHSIPSKDKKCDVAIPGVNGISVEMLGLFKGRTVEIFFDQDEAGQAGAHKLIEMLEKAGAKAINRTWDISKGSDINEVLINGYMK